MKTRAFRWSCRGRSVTFRRLAGFTGVVSGSLRVWRTWGVWIPTTKIRRHAEKCQRCIGIASRIQFFLLPYERGAFLRSRVPSSTPLSREEWPSPHHDAFAAEVLLQGRDSVGRFVAVAWTETIDTLPNGPG